MLRNKILVTVFILLGVTQFSFAQKTEWSFNAYSGLFSFRGNEATSNSKIFSYPFIPAPTNFTENPYGNKSEFSYALELQFQRINKRENIYGLGLAFEVLTSKVTINKVGVSGDPAYLEYAATGTTKLRNTFITLNPFVGHRFLANKITFDVLAGFDAALCLASRESGNAITNNKEKFTTENSISKPSIDIRPRVQLKMQVNKWGFLAGYSIGLTNYQTQNNSKAYSSFLRFGLSYLLK